MDGRPFDGALDAPEWRTSKNGKRFQIDTETGEIVKGNVGQSNFHHEARPLESTKPDKARYEALLKENGGDHKKAAHAYFREKLQGRYVKAKTDEGGIEACFTGRSWGEIKKDMVIDPIKAEIVPMIPEVLSSGKYKAETPQHDHPDVTVFHTYRKSVTTSAGQKEVIVDVAERPVLNPQNIVYSVTREGTRPYDDRKSQNILNEDSKKVGSLMSSLREKNRRPIRKPTQDGHTIVSASSGPIPGPIRGNLKTPTQDGRTVVEDSIRPFFEVVNVRFAGEA